jgi:CMP-N,N'-diacetyllegionaminic acid synthase
MNILITICGRGGSKGIPNKNIKLINGLPLIAYTIFTAQKFANLYKAKIALSTDSISIKDVAEKYNLFTDYLRTEKLANDTAGKIPVLNHLWNYEETKSNIKFDYILDLDITSPLRTIEDLTNAFNILIKDKNALNLISVSPARKNPYFNILEETSTGYYNVSKKLNNLIHSRQAAPKVYDANASFYIYKREFFIKNYSSAVTEKTLIFEVPHLCFDLDEINDFEYLSFLIEKNKLDFDL